MSAIASTPTTVEELLAMPDDGMDRELIAGQLRERPMTMRDHRHAGVEVNVAFVLKRWLVERPSPRGKIVSGEAGFCLCRNPDTFVGIDVAYISAELLAATPRAAFPEGAPTLAVEILSPSDLKEAIDEKIEAYLNAGVLMVWIVDPTLRTVTVIRPDAEPELFNVTQELSGEPHLPGFRVVVARIFED